MTALPNIPELEPSESARHPPWHLVRAAAIALLLVLWVAPLLAPYDPLVADGQTAFSPPSASHLLGTDSLGRDVLSRFLAGGRQTLETTLLATWIAVIPGLVVGTGAAILGGWSDRLLMAGMDVLLAFPGLLLALVVITLLGSGPTQVALAAGIAGLPGNARLTRAAILQVLRQPYIEAAVSIGASPLRILVWHVLANALSNLLGFAAIALSWALLTGTALTFLGFSGDPSIPDWGGILNEGRAAFRTAPWIALPPGIAITLTIFLATYLADRFQDDLAG